MTRITLAKSHETVEVSMEMGASGVVVSVELAESIPDFMWLEARKFATISDELLNTGHGNSAMAYIRDSVGNITAIILDTLSALDEMRVVGNCSA